MDIASTALELTGSDTRHRIPYKCPINVPRLQSGRNINARHRQTSSTIRTCMRHHSYPSYTSLTIVMLSARSRDPRFMASFVLTGGWCDREEDIWWSRGWQGFLRNVYCRDSRDRELFEVSWNVYSKKINFLACFWKNFFEKIYFLGHYLKSDLSICLHLITIIFILNFILKFFYIYF